MTTANTPTDARPDANTDTETLYRVGRPQMSDTWLDSFSASRDSGGLGAGVYAYATREGADGHNDRTNPPAYILTDVLENPLRVTDHERLKDLHTASQVMSAVARAERNTPGTVDDLRERYHASDTPDSLKGLHMKPDVFPTGPWGEEAVMTMYNVINAVLYVTDGSDRFTPDRHEIAERIFQACEDAAAQDGNRTKAMLKECPGLLQPINYLLFPAFDGIVPEPGAGGNSNRWGAVVFKQVVDARVGHATRSAEVVPFRALLRE